MPPGTGLKRTPAGLRFSKGISMSQHRLMPNKARTILQKLFEALGVPSEDAFVVADSLVAASLRGVDGHGIARAKEYIERLSAGTIRPSVDPEVLKELPSLLLVDGKNGIGQVVAWKVMQVCIERAKRHGICVAAIRHTNHIGMTSYYPLAAARKGLIGFCLSNASPSMAPWGGRTPAIGTNPLALAFPGTQDGEELVVDMAMSVLSKSEVRAAAREGRPLPPGCAVDSEGRPTTDPAGALEGALLPMGGHKGYALAVAVEALAGVLSGSGFGRGVGSTFDLYRPSDTGNLLGAVDLSFFLPLDEFRKRLGSLKEDLKSVPLAAGFWEVLVPGERAARCERVRSCEGIPISPKDLEDLRQLCRRFGLGDIDALP